MSLSTQEKIHILDIIANLDELAGYQVGGLVCIERQGKPWKINCVATTKGLTLTTVTGHAYSVTTGRPLDDAKGLCLQPLTLQRAQYIMAIEFKKAADKIDLSRLSEKQLGDLAGAAHTVLTLIRELRKDTPIAVRYKDRPRYGVVNTHEDEPLR